MLLYRDPIYSPQHIAVNRPYNRDPVVLYILHTVHKPYNRNPIILSILPYNIANETRTLTDELNVRITMRLFILMNCLKEFLAGVSEWNRKESSKKLSIIEWELRRLRVADQEDTTYIQLYSPKKYNRKLLNKRRKKCQINTNTANKLQIYLKSSVTMSLHEAHNMLLLFNILLKKTKLPSND